MSGGKAAKKRRGKPEGKAGVKKAAVKQGKPSAKPMLAVPREADEHVKELGEAVPGYEEYSPYQERPRHHEPHELQKRPVKKQASKLKKYLIISAVAIFSCIIIFFLLSKLRFVLNDELNLDLNPLHQSFAVENNETITFLVSVTNNNFAQCSAECSFSLEDISTGAVIYYDSRVMKHKESFEEEFNIEMPGKGRGQRVYSFESECKNIKTVVYLTDGELRIESATIIADYDLTEEEKRIVSEKKPFIEGWFLRIKELRGLYAQYKKIFTVLPDCSERDRLESVLVAAVPGIARVVDVSERVADTWSSEDYFSAEDYFSKSASDETESLIGLLKDSIQKAVDLVDARNSNIELLGQAGGYQSFSEELLAHCMNESSPENERRLKNLSAISSAVLEQHKMIIGRSEINEDELGRAIAQSLEKLEGMRDDFLLAKNRTDSLIMKGEELLKQRNPEINLSLGSGCEGLRAVIAEFERENNASSEPEEDGLNATDISNAALLDNTENKKQLATFCRPENYTQGMNASSKEAGIITSFIGLRFDELDNNKIISFPGPEDIPSQTTLPDSTLVCCADAKCYPCCTTGGCPDDAKRYPVIFIHGHSFNDANDPEYSLMAFSKIQRDLTDEGFVSFGELDLEADSKGDDGEWGMMGLPITVRGSYYYITHYDVGGYSVNVQKSESIENYALRLREIIELVRKKTGSSKVNIVAHSMGGLVTRQYLELFSHGKVDKVILIGTPNHGVSGKIRKLCSVLGARRECSELAEDSIFLKRLNSEPLPEGANVYSIRSTGCRMDGGEDGDGVVTAESAYLEGAMNYEIKGSCTSSFGTDLHTDALDPEKYPEMYELVLRILKE